MSIEKYPDNGSPLSEAENTNFANLAMNYHTQVRSERNNFELSNGEIWDRYLLRTIDGELDFIVQKVDNKSEISPREPVICSLYEPSDMLRSFDFKLDGASEAGFITKTSLPGTIEQYADLNITEMQRQPLSEEDSFHDVIRTQMGFVRLRVISRLVLPIVLDLAYVYEDGSMEYIFKHKV